MPKNTPMLVDVPKANYIAVRGKGNPKEEDGEYKLAIRILYAVAYTLKMSYKTEYRMDGFFEYVVPPLEGFWWQENVKGCDYENKESFHWISVIRVPDFVKERDVKWAVGEATKKKRLIAVKLSILRLKKENVFRLCILVPLIMRLIRLHHQIYLSDTRKVSPENGKQ